MKAKLRKLVCTALCGAMMAVGLSAQAAGTQLPILMYHDITTDPAKTNSMTVTDERFRLDMEFLQQFGYTAVLPADLIAIQQGQAAMPEKPVMITFDDGYRSNYTMAYPVLQQNNLKAAIAVVAINIQNENHTTADRHILTWTELRAMSESGVVEVGLHTYNLHNPQYTGNTSPNGIDGVQRLNGESKSAYNARVGSDLTIGLSLIRQYIGVDTVNYFSYPFGAYDSWMPPLLSQNGVRVSTLTNPGVANIANGLNRLPRYRIEMKQPLSSLLRQRENAVPSLAAVSVNGAVEKLPAYNIGGSNYVRVRDVAKLLTGTAGGFDVQWNQEQNRVELTSFKAYTPLGTEYAAIPGDTKNVQSIVEPTVADGETHMVAAFNIGGNTFYKLRSLGDLCGFRVDWNESTQTVEITA